jgi:protein-tyrosine phosphatase
MDVRAGRAGLVAGQQPGRPRGCHGRRIGIVFQMDRHVRLDRVHNLRDVGGYPAAGGRMVAWGRLYRSDSLANLDGQDLARFGKLGIRTVIDLRYPDEIQRNGRVPDLPGLTFHNFSVEHRPYDQTIIDPSVEPAPFFADRYAEVAADGVIELRQTLEVIAGLGELPLLFNCHAGKDRTGIVAALVLSLLGVDRADVVADFALSNLATVRFMSDHAAQGRPIPQWSGFARAPADAMRMFLDGIDERYGSVRGYARQGLRLGEGALDDLATRLLD